MTRFAYPASAMLGDYLRTAAGLLPSAALLAIVPVGPVAGVMLGGFVAIFAAFGCRTALRHGTRLELSETGLCARGLWRTEIAWSGLDRMKLAYYSTRRDRREGWMQLELGCGRARVRVDSRIVGFERLVECSASAAASRGLALNPATLANLQALGVTLPAGLREDRE